VGNGLQKPASSTPVQRTNAASLDGVCSRGRVDVIQLIKLDNPAVNFLSESQLCLQSSAIATAEAGARPPVSSPHVVFPVLAQLEAPERGFRFTIVRTVEYGKIRPYPASFSSSAMLRRRKMAPGAEHAGTP